jgi:uncharacterized protein YndB with AHSA1/START domain
MVDHGSRGAGPVTVSRRIAAPAAEIFKILADPRRHIEFDGSGMFRGAVSEHPVGAVFVMRMHHRALGDYEMNNHVVAYEPNRRIGWEPEAGRAHPDNQSASASPSRWGHTVTEIHDCSRAPEDEQVAMDGGRIWIDSMLKTLERLEALTYRCRP